MKIKAVRLISFLTAVFFFVSCGKSGGGSGIESANTKNIYKSWLEQSNSCFPTYQEFVTTNTSPEGPYEFVAELDIHSNTEAQMILHNNYRIGSPFEVDCAVTCDLNFNLTPDQVEISTLSSGCSVASCGIGVTVNFDITSSYYFDDENLILEMDGDTCSQNYVLHLAE